MPNPNPILKMNSTDAPKPGPLTSIGKFRAALNAYKGKTKVPAEVQELFEWTISMNTSELNELTELKNLYKVLKRNSAATIMDKMIAGEELNKRDIEILKLLKDTLVDTHKLKYGDKTTIEHKVTALDLRNAIFAPTPNKKVIHAKVLQTGTEETPGNPSERVVEEEPVPAPIIQKAEVVEDKKILIVGYPKVGKSNYSERFENVIHTDSYIKLDFKKQIYQVLEDIQDKDKWVIEGIQGIRLFRKMLQLNQNLPDKVIYLRPKYPPDENHKSTRKMLDTVCEDCLRLNKETKIIYEEA